MCGEGTDTKTVAHLFPRAVLPFSESKNRVDLNSHLFRQGIRRSTLTNFLYSPALNLGPSLTIDPHSVQQRQSHILPAAAGDNAKGRVVRIDIRQHTLKHQQRSTCNVLRV